MNSKAFFLCAAISLAGGFSHGQNLPDPSPMTSSDPRLAPLIELKITHGTMIYLRRDDSPTMTAPDGRIRNNLPPRTIVRLLLQPAKGSNINVEIWLPDAEKWNGRFLGLGNGGAAGNIDPNGLAGPLAGGNAVASTDMGTAPNADSGIANPEVWKDFGFRATHLMTLAAKQVITAYYGRPPEYSYFNGGSTGGQQALQEAQRYPEDYDGIVAAIPAHCRTPLHAYFLWNDQILKKCPLTPEQDAHIIAAADEIMAGRQVPPAAGKFIADPRADGKEIEAVIALAMKKDPTLTPDHAEALRKIFDGPRHAVTGERIFNGVPLGSSINAAHGHLYLFKWVFGPDKKMEDINFGADIDAYTAALGPYLNAENADLSAFEKRGGKLLMVSGSADSIVPYHATLDYYERVIEHFGSLEKVKSFYRFYLIPGMAHWGGPGVSPSQNLVELVKNWREKGIAPERLEGAHRVEGKIEFEMPFYPYPSKTGWDSGTAGFQPVDGPRGGVERVGSSFRPAAAE